MTRTVRNVTAVLCACLVSSVLPAQDRESGNAGQPESPDTRFNPEEFTLDKNVPQSGPAVLPEVDDEVIVIFEHGDARRREAPAKKR